MSPQKNQNPFSRRLSEYITSSGYTVYKISQLTGLGRTAIQHVMSGSLVPSRDFYDTLCSALTITPRQRSELDDLYLREKIGVRAYTERRKLLSIAENLPHYLITSAVSELPQFTVPAAVNDCTASGLLAVNNLLMGVILNELSRSSASVITTIPFDNKLFFDLICQSLSAYRDNLSFEHFFRIYKCRDDEECKNTDILESVLRLSVNGGMSYKPYYYYAFPEAAEDGLSLYPYMLLTSERLVLISGDFCTASVFSDKAVTAAAGEHINRLRQTCRIMVQPVDNRQMIDVFTQNTRLLSKSLEFQPCMSTFITLETARKRIVDIPEKEYILKTVEEQFFTPGGLPETEQQDATIAFSRDGLEHFARTGVILDLIGQLLTPLSEDERIQMLTDLRSAAASDEASGRSRRFVLLDRNRINIPDFMQMVSLSNNTCIIACTSSTKKFYGILSENSLVSSIDDFISSLCEPDMCLPQDELIRAIDSCIDRLKASREAD